MTYAANAQEDATKGVMKMPVNTNALARRQERWFDNEPNSADGSADFTYHPIKLLGRPINPIFQQEKFLPFGVNMMIQLDKASDKFVLMNGETEDYEITIEDIKLFVEYVQLSAGAFEAK